MQTINRIVRSIVIVSLILSLTVVSAWAEEEMIGIFEGTRVCTLYDGTRQRARLSELMGLFNTEENEFVLFFFDVEDDDSDDESSEDEEVDVDVEELYLGIFIQDANRDNRAGATFVGCQEENGFFGALSGTVAAELMFRNNGGITFKAQSTHAFVLEDDDSSDEDLLSGAWATCRWNFKLVEEDDLEDIFDIDDIDLEDIEDVLDIESCD